MANTDFPRGMWPVEGTGGSTSPRVRAYYATPAAVAIARGAPVELVDGHVTRATAGSSFIVGVAAHFKTSASSSGDKQILVFDDPHQVFSIQSDGSLTDAQTYIGAHFTIINASTYNATTLQSKAELDASTGSRIIPTEAIDHQVQVVGISQKHGSSEANRSFVECHVLWVPNKNIYLKATTKT